MPNMDGDDCFQKLREMCPDVPVVLSSGYNVQIVSQRFLGKGLAGFIQKPYVLGNLIETLRNVLEKP